MDKSRLFKVVLLLLALGLSLAHNVLPHVHTHDRDATHEAWHHDHHHHYGSDHSHTHTHPEEPPTTPADTSPDGFWASLLHFHTQGGHSHAPMQMQQVAQPLVKIQKTATVHPAVALASTNQPPDDLRPVRQRFIFHQTLTDPPFLRALSQRGPPTLG